jgi:hypothetical protein
MSDSSAVFVDTDALSRAVLLTSELSERLAGIYAGLAGTVGSLGNVWGPKNDPIGGPFGKVYEPNSQALLAGIGSTGQSLGSTGDGIKTLVKGYTATEEANILTAAGSAGNPDGTRTA